MLEPAGTFFHSVGLICAWRRILSSYRVGYERACTMKTFLLVTSPPASGKTFIAKQLASMLQNCVYLDKDSVIVLFFRPLASRLIAALPFLSRIYAIMNMTQSSRSPLRRWNSTTACSLMRPLPVRCAILYGWRRCVEGWRRWVPGFRWFGCIRIWRFAENGCRCAPPSGILGNWHIGRTMSAAGILTLRRAYQSLS